MKSTLFIWLFSFVLTFCLLKYTFSTKTDYTTFALGTQTVTYWAKDSLSYPIHISTLDSSNFHLIKKRWKKNNSKNVILILGNSQSHSINQKKDKQVTFTELISNKINNHFVLANSFPNASLQDFYISYFYFINNFPVKYVVIPVFLDDMREVNGIDYDFFPEIIKNNSYLLDRKKDNLSIKLSKYIKDKNELIRHSSEKLNQTSQEKSELYINDFLTKHYDIWYNRTSAQGFIFGTLYELRNSLFNIKPTTIRKMIPDRYNDNLSALNNIINDALEKKIKILLYIPPIRKDVNLPYDSNEYNKLKFTLKNIVKVDTNHLFYKDYDNIVPSKFFGVKESTNLGNEKVEIDFMHFQFLGHKILSDSICNFFKKNNIQ